MKWLAVVAALIAGPVAACGEDTDCVVGDRTYRIAGAENAPNGALIFAHGYRGSAAGVMRNRGLAALADDFGLALIAMAYGIGPVSGCHINPAVSLGAVAAGRMTMPEAIKYIIAQVAGAIAAAFKR